MRNVPSRDDTTTSTTSVAVGDIHHRADSLHSNAMIVEAAAAGAAGSSSIALHRTSSSDSTAMLTAASSSVNLVVPGGGTAAVNVPTVPVPPPALPPTKLPGGGGGGGDSFTQFEQYVTEVYTSGFPVLDYASTAAAPPSSVSSSAMAGGSGIGPPSFVGQQQEASYSVLALRQVSVSLQGSASFINSVRSILVTDMSDTFRLFFGTNIMVVPFIVSLGGYLGVILLAIPVVFCAYEAFAAQLRAKAMLMQTESPEDFHHRQQRSSNVRGGKQQDKEGATAFLAKHRDISSYFTLADRLWENHHNTSASTTNSGGGSIMPTIVRLVIVMYQFCSACGLLMLLASNLSALLGFSLLTSLLASVVLFVVLCAHTSHSGVVVLSLISNVTLLLVMLILLFATVTHANITPDEAKHLLHEHSWMMPRTTIDAFLALPLLAYYLQNTVLCLDAENIQATKLALRENNSNSGGSSSLAVTVTAPLDSWFSPHHRTMTRFLVLTAVSISLAFFLLIFFGEFIFSTFKSRTNAVIALSLHAGPLRTVLLVVLCVGVAVRVQSFFPLVALVESGASAAMSARTIAARQFAATAGRVALFLSVLAMVLFIPHFDLLIGIAGSLGGGVSAFIMPGLFELQAHLRTTKARSYRVAFMAMPRRSKLAVVGLVVVGFLVLVLGLWSSIHEAIRRKTTTPPPHRRRDHQENFHHPHSGSSLHTTVMPSPM